MTHARATARPPHLVIASLVGSALVAACAGSNAQPSAAALTSTPAFLSTPAATATSAATATASRAPTATPTATLATSPAPSYQPQRLHLTEHPINLTDVPVGSLTGCASTGGCQGDYMVGADPLFDAATGDEVGTLLFVCFLVDPGSTMFECPGITIDLTGRGQIAFSEKFDGSRQTSPIIGGTGEFLGAMGTVTSWLPPSGNGDFAIEISGWETRRAGQAPTETPDAGPARTIHVREPASNPTRVQVGTLTGCTDTICQGDYIVGNDALVDADTGEDVGTFVYECFVVDPGSNLYHCPESAIILAERGQIVFTGAMRYEADMPAAIAPMVGGTGEFLGATGTVTGTTTASGDRDFLIEFSASEAPAASQPIHVLEEPVEFTDVSFGSLAGCTRTDGCQGDLLIGRSRMLDATTQGTAGTLLVACFLFDPDERLYHCPANTITLPGRGQIVYTETLLFRVAPRAEWEKWAPWPIIGGTDEFLGVTGTVDSPADSTWSAGDFVITIAN